MVCFLFVLFLLHRLNFVSVVFDFNASLSDFAPISPISLSFNLIGMKVSVLLMNGVCVVFFFLRLLPRLSCVSVVFDFNASLNDVVPVSPILFPD